MRFGEIKKRLMPMLDDAAWAERALEADDNQFTRRAYIRSIFAMIEGTIWVLKQIVINAPVTPGAVKRLLPGEYEMLSDKAYDLKSNGQIREQPRYLNLPDNTRFTFSILSKYFGVQIELGVGAQSWQDFLTAQGIRNRITHPREEAEFVVTDDEIEVCKRACSWFNALVAALFSGIATSRAAVPRARVILTVRSR